MKTFSAVVALFAFTAQSAFAVCSCALNSTPEEAVAGADAVFVSKTVEVRIDSLGFRKLARLKVEEAFKGVSQTFRGADTDTLTVSTFPSSQGCGYGFGEGERDLIYAYLDGNTFETSLCTHSVRASDTLDVLTALRNGEVKLGGSPTDCLDSEARNRLTGTWHTETENAEITVTFRSDCSFQGSLKRDTVESLEGFSRIHESDDGLTYLNLYHKAVGSRAYYSKGLMRFTSADVFRTEAYYGDDPPKRLSEDALTFKRKNRERTE